MPCTAAARQPPSSAVAALILPKNGVLERISEEKTIHGNVDHAVAAQLAVPGAAMQTRDQSAPGWTVVLRRQPARIVGGRAEGGYTDVFELICCDCGDHPDLDYREVPADLQRIRGPYPVAVGITAYGLHRELLHRRPARMRARYRDE